jgi:hypothetical protein
MTPSNIFCQLNKLLRSGTKEQQHQRVFKFLGLSIAEDESSQQSAEQGKGSKVAFLEFGTCDLAYKFKSFFYFACVEVAKQEDVNYKILVQNIKNIANHWASDYLFCSHINPDRNYVRRG